MMKNSLTGEHPSLLDEVLITEQLQTRTSRAPDHAAESLIVEILTNELASNPANLLQRLAEAAVNGGVADSVGVSILVENSDNPHFLWVAVAGQFAHHLGGMMPRHDSPCGLVIEKNATLLLNQPGRVFSMVADVEPPVYENLLIPFHLDGKPVGTIWLVAHTPDGRFDSEHARLIERISHFAAVGHRLASSLDAAEQASRAKSHFLAMMSHELRTPLTSVVAYSELIETESLGPTTSKQREALQRIKSSAAHLVDIIEEVLTLSRMEAGKESVQWLITDICRLTRVVVRMVEPMVDPEKVQLKLIQPEADLQLRTDPPKLRQILNNLLGNAVKFTESGFVTVEVTPTPEGGVSISVSDSGPGIAQRDQEVIFEPFAQLDTTLTRRTAGSGLGLAISRRLARLIGGEITVQSRLGAGSTFTLVLSPTSEPS